MTDTCLAKLFEHNNWANSQMIRACAALTDEQLDAEPQSASFGSIRRTLVHLVAAQRNYLSLLTGAPRLANPPALAELEESAHASGEGLLALASDEAGKLPKTQLRTRDNHLVEPWVLMVQAINHATEHREQLNSMLSALGVTPLDLDGWSFGEATGALASVSPS